MTDNIKTPSHLITLYKHLPSLEGWRGVLALLVVLFHFSELYFNEKWAPYGYLSVDFFFVLSGFVITRQYEARIALHLVDLKTFASRRLARLWPLYIVSILAACAINEYVLEVDSPLRIQEFGMGPNFIIWLVVEFLMLGGLFRLPQPNGPVWSIAVEWVVNLCFFALLRTQKRVSNLFIWAVIICGTCYVYNLTPHSLETPGSQIPLVRGFIGFCIGWLIFRYHTYLPRLSRVTLYCIEGALIFFTLYCASNFTRFQPYSIDYVFQLLIIPALMLMTLYRAGILNAIFSNFLFTFLGRISYSIYLLHYPLTYMVVSSEELLKLGTPTLGILYFSLLIGFATLTYFLIELPGRWAGYKLTKRIRKEPAQEA